MNKEEGVITKTAGDIAWVKVRRSSMCEVCNSRNVCNTLTDESMMEAEVLNLLKGKIGDRVEFIISTSSLLKISTLLYIFPVIFLLTGAIIGYELFSPSELFALLFGLAGFFISYFVIRIIAERMAGHRKFTPEIIRILKN